MIADVITYSPNLIAFRNRLKAHKLNDIGLAKSISSNDEGTEFWIEPFKTRVLVNGNKSIALARVKHYQAYGVFDEEGNQKKPSLVEAININPLNGKVEPVMIDMAIGDCRGRIDISPFEKLDSDEIAIIREFWPETVTRQDEDGNDVTVNQPLMWEMLA